MNLLSFNSHSYFLVHGIIFLNFILLQGPEAGNEEGKCFVHFLYICAICADLMFVFFSCLSSTELIHHL